MKRMNIIVIFDKDITSTLMCKRTKEPYKGMYNFVGGKIENDNGLEEAYRELYEETNISKNDIKLVYFMNLSYLFKLKKLSERLLHSNLLTSSIRLTSPFNTP